MTLIFQRTTQFYQHKWFNFYNNINPKPGLTYTTDSPVLLSRSSLYGVLIALYIRDIYLQAPISFNDLCRRGPEKALLERLGVSISSLPSYIIVIWGVGKTPDRDNLGILFVVS